MPFSVAIQKKKSCCYNCNKLKIDGRQKQQQQQKTTTNGDIHTHTDTHRYRQKHIGYIYKHQQICKTHTNTHISLRPF